MAGSRGSRPLDSVALLLLLLLVYPGFMSLSLLLAGSSAKIKGMSHGTGMGLTYVNWRFNKGKAPFADCSYILTISNAFSQSQQRFCIQRLHTVRITNLIRTRVADPDSIGLVDPDPYSKSESGSRRAKITHIRRKKLRNLMFWRAGCSLFRDEGFFCNLDVLFGGLGIGKL